VKLPLSSPGHYLNWLYGDVIRNGNMVAKARHAIRSPSRSLFVVLKQPFPQDFAYNTIEQWSFRRVRKKWRLAKRLWVSKQKPHSLVLFLVSFLHDKTPNRWKNQVCCNFSPVWKKYVVIVYKIGFYLVVVLYWSTTASLGPRFFKSQIL